VVGSLTGDRSQEMAGEFFSRLIHPTTLLLDMADLRWVICRKRPS
jgi:hypothetical protein